MRSDVQGEFEEHAEEERHHAQLLADRIIELEGVPVLDPKQWFELARCKYDSPTDFDVVSLLNQNVASERCAILRYQEIAKFTDGIDFTTCDIAKHILAEEEEHEQDLQDYLTDIARMKKIFPEIILRKGKTLYNKNPLRDVLETFSQGILISSTLIFVPLQQSVI